MIGKDDAVQIVNFALLQVAGLPQTKQRRQHRVVFRAAGFEHQPRFVRLRDAVGVVNHLKAVALSAHVIDAGHIAEQLKMQLVADVAAKFQQMLAGHNQRVGFGGHHRRPERLVNAGGHRTGSFGGSGIPFRHFGRLDYPLGPRFFAGFGILRLVGGAALFFQLIFDQRQLAGIDDVRPQNRHRDSGHRLILAIPRHGKNRLRLNFLLQGNDAVEQGLGCGRAARHVHIHRDVFIDAGDHVVAFFKRAAAAGAGTHADDIFGFGHLVVQADNLRHHFFGDRAGDNHQIRLAGGGAKEGRAKAVLVVAAGAGGNHFDGAAGQAKSHWPERVSPAPVIHGIEFGEKYVLT